MVRRAHTRYREAGNVYSFMNTLCLFFFVFFFFSCHSAFLSSSLLSCVFVTFCSHAPRVVFCMLFIRYSTLRRSVITANSSEDLHPLVSCRKTCQSVSECDHARDARFTVFNDNSIRHYVFTLANFLFTNTFLSKKLHSTPLSTQTQIKNCSYQKPARGALCDHRFIYTVDEPIFSGSTRILLPCHFLIFTCPSCVQDFVWIAVQSDPATTKVMWCEKNFVEAKNTL